MFVKELFLALNSDVWLGTPMQGGKRNHGTAPGFASVFSIANRAEDVETLNAVLARLRQQFHTKSSREIYEHVNAAYQGGTPVPALFAVVVREIQNQPPESDSRPKNLRRARSRP